MAQRNDQIFQLSLTEIAFTIAFILLLLLGYLVSREQSERLAAEAALAKVQTVQRAEAALDSAKNTLKEALQGIGAPNPDDVITKLVAADDIRADRDRLKQKVVDLDSKLTALTELQNRVEKAAKSARPDITKEEINAALVLQEQVLKSFEQEPPEDSLAFGKEQVALSAKPEAPSSSLEALKGASSAAASQKPREPTHAEAVERVKQAIAATGELKMQLKEQLGMDMKPGQLSQTVREVVAAARSYGDLAKSGTNPETVKKENSDLRGQVAFLKNRLDARGGRDYPPCWADENGKVEFLFLVEVRQDSVVMSPAWPQRREVAARALPGISEALAGPHSNQGFVSKIQGVFNWSKTQDPECRFYVQLKSSISDAVQSDRARLMVENYFYKVEMRR